LGRLPSSDLLSEAAQLFRHHRWPVPWQARQSPELWHAWQWSGYLSTEPWPGYPKCPEPLQTWHLPVLRIPMMVMGDSHLIVMVVSERNDHHDRSEATLTL
jgi:hypothetical protein